MTAIDKRIFRERSFAAPPNEVGEPIVRLCGDLSPGHKPIYVNCLPDPTARPAECFFNVEEKVARDGGKLVNGWAIWEWRTVFIEGEHHAVWEKDGHLIDITPHIPAETQVLFLPDPDRQFDRQSLRRLTNVKRSLGILPTAQSWIDASENLQCFIENGRRSGERAISVPLERLAELESRKLQAQGAVLESLARRTRPNERCICRSGRKFKKCCGPLIDLHATA